MKEGSLFVLWEILIFATENSNKFPKTRFWKEKSVENVITLEGLLFNSSITSFHIWLFKKIDTYIAKQCSHVKFPYFVMGSHLGQGHRPHQSIYEARQFISFLYFVVMRCIEPGCFRSHSWSLSEALEEDGCIRLVSWHLDLHLEVHEY